MKKIGICTVVLISTIFFCCNESNDEIKKTNNSSQILREKTNDVNKLKAEYKSIVISESFIDFNNSVVEFMSYIPNGFDIDFEENDVIYSWLENNISETNFSNLDEAYAKYNNVKEKYSVFLNKNDEFYKDVSTLSDIEQQEVFNIDIPDETLIIVGNPINYVTNAGPCENGCINEGVYCYRAAQRRYNELMQASSFAAAHFDIPLAVIIAAYASANFSSAQGRCARTMTACQEGC